MNEPLPQMDQVPVARPDKPVATEAQRQQIREFVERIVRRTRLWRREKNEVRVELQDHFEDGLAAGQSLEPLFADFGEPRLAARLIRQAKIRNRPLSWRVAHRVVLACSLVLCICITGVSIQLARIHLARLGPQTDYVGQLDQTVTQIPVTDRGWPEYRAGLMLFNRTPREQVAGKDVIREALEAGPSDPHWEQAIHYLDSQQPAVKLFVKASTFPRLGFVYRDEDNDRWLLAERRLGAKEAWPTDSTFNFILLPHYQDLGRVRECLYEAALRALHYQDQPEFHKYWLAQLRLGQQVLAENDFMIAQAYGRATIANALALLRRQVLEYPDAISSQQLSEYREELEGLKLTSQISTVEEVRKGAQAFQDAVYSRDAQGNGRITAAGALTLKRSYLSLHSREDTFVWEALLPEITAAGVLNGPGPYGQTKPDSVDINQEWLAMRWSLTLANRQEMHAKMESLLEALREEVEQPLAKRRSFEDSKYMSELRQIATTPDLLRRFWPILTVFPSRDLAWWPEESEQRQLMARDATLTVIALEQFRRRTGKWPEHLEQLVPADLPTLPQDAFSGQPLKYRIARAAPLLYSIWENRQDDHGVPSPEGAYSLTFGSETAKPAGDFLFAPSSPANKK